MCVIVIMRLFGVLLFFFVTSVIVAVGQVVVVVFVRVPVRPMFPLSSNPFLVMVRDMVMIVRVLLCWVRMVRLFAFALGVLLSHKKVSLLDAVCLQCGTKTGAMTLAETIPPLAEILAQHVPGIFGA